MSGIQLLELPPNVVLKIFSKCDVENLLNVSLTCKTIKRFIDDNRNSLPSRRIYHIDLDRRRVRAWREISWCDRIPFISLEYVGKFFANVHTKVLTVNALDEELAEFLTTQSLRYSFTFEQLRLFHSIECKHESISRLIQFAGCRAINFEAARSHMRNEHLELKGYHNLDSLCFEMDDSIDSQFFDELLESTSITKFIFHGCDNITADFIKKMFKMWTFGNRKIDCVRITTNQNISFQYVTIGLPIEEINHCTWLIINDNGEKAIITMRRNNFHFFLAFEVNCPVENILYKIPIIE